MSEHGNRLEAESEEDTEEVITGWWDRQKKRVEILKSIWATKKFIVTIWTLVFGLGGTALVTDTNPLREVGLVESKVYAEVEHVHEIVNVPVIQGPQGEPGPSGVGKTGPPGPQGPPGKDAVPIADKDVTISHPHPELEAMIKALQARIPKEHKKLH